MRLAIIIAVLISASSAFADEPADPYVHHYASGIRAYAESRYDEALTELYRAFAIKQTHLALKLIARSHDFQGNCSARDKTVTMLHDLYPDEAAPQPQRCEVVGEIRVLCAPEDGPVRVDEAFGVSCATVVAVPVGQHTVLHGRLRLKTVVTVEPGQTTVAEFRSAPDKWYLDARQLRVVELPKEWIRPSLLNDPDMPRSFEWKRP